MRSRTRHGDTEGSGSVLTPAGDFLLGAGQTRASNRPGLPDTDSDEADVREKAVAIVHGSVALVDATGRSRNPDS